MISAICGVVHWTITQFRLLLYHLILFKNSFLPQLLLYGQRNHTVYWGAQQLTDTWALKKITLLTGAVFLSQTQVRPLHFLFFLYFLSRPTFNSNYSLKYSNTTTPCLPPTSLPLVDPSPPPTPLPDPSPYPTPLPLVDPSPPPTPLPPVDPSPSPTPLPLVDPSPSPTPLPLVDPSPPPTPLPLVDPSPPPTPLPLVDPSPPPTPLPLVDPSPSPTPLPLVDPSPHPKLPRCHFFSLKHHFDPVNRPLLFIWMSHSDNQSE